MVDSGDGTYAMAYSATAETLGPTDKVTRGQDGIVRRMRDNGDGTYSEVIVVDGIEGGSGPGGDIDGGTP